MDPFHANKLRNPDEQSSHTPFNWPYAQSSTPSNTMPSVGHLEFEWERKAVLLSLASVVLLIILILYKFTPDLGYAYVNKESIPTLVSLEEYKRIFLVEPSPHTGRFLGNRIQYHLAQIINHFVSSSDVRLTPLRIAAAILTPIYFVIGALPIFTLRNKLDWRVFLALYSYMFICGMYVLVPGDAPSIAFLSLGIGALLLENLPLMVFWMIITGLFRESAFHLVVQTGIWFALRTNLSFKRRFLWIILTAAVFLIEYKLIRYIVPYASLGFKDPIGIFADKGFWSLTTIVSLGIASLFPVSYWFFRDKDERSWQSRLFMINCYLFPIWILFYRLLNGNISEFRMLWPILMPFVFGLAWRPQLTSVNLSNMSE